MKASIEPRGVIFTILSKVPMSHYEKLQPARVGKALKVQILWVESLTHPTSQRTLFREGVKIKESGLWK